MQSKSYKRLSNIRNPMLLALVLISIFTAPIMAGWETKWIDRFDGNGVNWDNWTAQTQANYNNEVQCYTDDDNTANKNYDVSNGTLKIIARKQTIACPGQNQRQRSWTSGRINSKDKSEFLYGRIEARIRFNELKGGTWPAFWMLENRIFEQPIANDNDNVNWPNQGAGEIDVWEWYSNNPTRYITNFFNVNGCGSEYRYTYPGGATDVQQWHKYAIEWDEDNIAFYVDDTLVRSHNVTNCPQYKEPMFVLLNVAMGGTLGGNIDTSLNTATMEVDYVAHCTATDTNQAAYCDESTPTSFVSAPVITGSPITSINTDEQYSYRFTATDSDGDILIFASPTLPTWLTFDTATGILSGTASSTDVGIHPVILTVTDGTNTVNQTFSITVVALPNTPPTITSSNMATSAVVGTAYNYTFTATDLDGDDLTMSADTLPAWLSFDVMTGLLTGTATSTDIGNHDVTLAVTDGEDSISQVFTIKVVQAPVVDVAKPTGSSGGSTNPILLILMFSLLTFKRFISSFRC